MVHFDRLNDVHLVRYDWKVSVKIIRKWNKRDDDIFTSGLGDKMQATISDNLVHRLCIHKGIEEDEWKTILNFKVEVESSGVKVVDTNYRIKFTTNTILENIDSLLNNQFMDYQTLDKINDGWSALANIFCLDTMWEIVRVEPMIHVDDPTAVRYNEKI
ncbi:PREDICTED: uncharacterized protein LOC109128844 [Camelina sativa]|uniref:Uncharacterized protein LOC109128844 n=1 Tax=Camelina sativa TaxID=90675 RepID=A0ABM1QXL5_CAMSA|nr:PREDICTED: uncharacterized protein LOC109128844 [Camelina sativa]